MYDQDEFNSYFALWQLEDHSPDWPLFKSAEAADLVRSRAASYGGMVSISHFIRAFSELRASGEVKQLRQPRPVAIEEPQLTPEAYRSIPASVTTRRYMTDPDFKIQVDSLIERGLI
jgi:hypothetical protein